MSVLLNLRLVDSLVAPRREQSGAKNIPREAPLRHFLSGVSFFSSIPTRYPRARRAFGIGDIARWHFCFLDTRIDQRCSTIVSRSTIWFRQSIVPAFHESTPARVIVFPHWSSLLIKIVFSRTSLFIIWSRENEDVIASVPLFLRRQKLSRRVGSVYAKQRRNARRNTRRAILNVSNADRIRFIAGRRRLALVSRAQHWPRAGTRAEGNCARYAIQPGAQGNRHHHHYYYYYHRPPASPPLPSSRHDHYHHHHRRYGQPRSRWAYWAPATWGASQPATPGGLLLARRRVRRWEQRRMGIWTSGQKVKRVCVRSRGGPAMDWPRPRLESSYLWDRVPQPLRCYLYDLYLLSIPLSLALLLTARASFSFSLYLLLRLSSSRSSSLSLSLPCSFPSFLLPSCSSLSFSISFPPPRVISSRPALLGRHSPATSLCFNLKVTRPPMLSRTPDRHMSISAKPPLHFFAALNTFWWHVR